MIFSIIKNPPRKEYNIKITKLVRGKLYACSYGFICMMIKDGDVYNLCVFGAGEPYILKLPDVFKLGDSDCMFMELHNPKLTLEYDE